MGAEAVLEEDSCWPLSRRHTGMVRTVLCPDAHGTFLALEKTTCILLYKHTCLSKYWTYWARKVTYPLDSQKRRSDLL